MKGHEPLRNDLSVGEAGAIISTANKLVEAGYRENNSFKKFAALFLFLKVGWPVNVALSMAKEIGKNAKKPYVTSI